MPSHTFWVIHPMEGNAVDLRNHCTHATLFLMVLSHQVKLGFKIGGRLHSLIFLTKTLNFEFKISALFFSTLEYLLGVLF